MEPRPIENGRGRTMFRFNETPQELCAAAPCVKDIPAGSVLLGFPVVGREGLETELVYLGTEPSVYRRQLSVYEDRTGATRVLGILATVFGGTALMTGAVLLPVGLGDDRDTLAAAGGITLGTGALLLTLGILAVNADAPTFRPGAANHFPLAPAP